MPKFKLATNCKLSLIDVRVLLLFQPTDLFITILSLRCHRALL